VGVGASNVSVVCTSKWPHSWNEIAERQSENGRDGAIQVRHIVSAPANIWEEDVQLLVLWHLAQILDRCLKPRLPASTHSAAPLSARARAEERRGSRAWGKHAQAYIHVRTTPQNITHLSQQSRARLQLQRRHVPKLFFFSPRPKCFRGCHRWVSVEPTTLLRWKGVDGSKSPG
jgi:hypothetical protein